MKKMGELYEIVVFTASLSKVNDILTKKKKKILIDTQYSMLILYWISLIYIMSFIIDYFENRVILTKELTLK